MINRNQIFLIEIKLQKLYKILFKEVQPLHDLMHSQGLYKRPFL